VMELTKINLLDFMRSSFFRNACLPIYLLGMVSRVPIRPMLMSDENKVV
jgi:hypothetical protein